MYIIPFNGCFSHPSQILIQFTNQFFSLFFTLKILLSVEANSGIFLSLFSLTLFHFLTSLVLPLGWCKRTAGNKDKQKAIRYRKISFISQVVLIFQTPTHFFLYAPKSEPICQPIGELTISHIANLLRVSLAYLHMEKMASLIQWA